jgi:hypothetical protein
MTYAWASYDFMYEGYGSSEVDGHTYIHETGHVLGLDDYYSYTEGDWGAAGGLDMMDYNVLDHNAYSKFFLGWSDPFVVDGTKAATTINLSPFESSGQFILINDEWNGSAFDEYLAIEFYTPTGLNYQDSRVGGYPGNNVRGFTVPGIKIYHVDARLGLFSSTSGAFLSYTDSAVGSASSYPFIAHSNSPNTAPMRITGFCICWKPVASTRSWMGKSPTMTPCSGPATNSIPPTLRISLPKRGTIQ